MLKIFLKDIRVLCWPTCSVREAQVAAGRSASIADGQQQQQQEGEEEADGDAAEIADDYKPTPGFHQLHDTGDRP